MKKVLLVVDVNNLFYTTKKKFGEIVDYSRLMEMAESQGSIHRAIAYGSEMDGQATKFKNILESIGFEIKFKAPKIWRDLDGKETRKADWDVAIAIDIVRILPTVDVVIIVSADSDMTEVAKFIQEQGKIVHIIGCGISRELKETVNRWYEIENSDLIQRKSLEQA